LKENAENILLSLDTLSSKTEVLLKEGFHLTKEMKQRKIKDMGKIDTKFEKLIKMVQMKKAQLKKEYNDAFNIELSRVNQEQENFEKHMSLVAFNKDTVTKTANELE
jgi:transcription initiation factor TFIIIB Brf1 subunit/transcription initiation factor TFIIB